MNERRLQICTCGICDKMLKNDTVDFISLEIIMNNGLADSYRREGSWQVSTIPFQFGMI